MADNSGWAAILSWAETVNPVPFVAGAGTLLAAYFAGAKGLRDSGSAARKTKADADIALRGRLSIEAQEALDRKEADNAALRAEKAACEKDAEVAWDTAHAYEDWARDFARHDFNNALTEMDAVYRILARVIANPREDRAWEMAQAALDNRKTWPTPVVPSPGTIRTRTS